MDIKVSEFQEFRAWLLREAKVRDMSWTQSYAMYQEERRLEYLQRIAGDLHFFRGFLDGGDQNEFLLKKMIDMENRQDKIERKVKKLMKTPPC